MIKYDKSQSFKCDAELDAFLKSLSKKYNFITSTSVYFIGRGIYK